MTALDSEVQPVSECFIFEPPRSLVAAGARPTRLPRAVLPPGMATTGTRDRTDLVKNAGVVTTLVDAAMEFVKGRPKSGAVLLGAAAVSSRIPGFGTLVSLGLRAYRRLR